MTLNSSKLTEIIITMLKEDHGFYQDDAKILEKFENYVKDLGNVTKNEIRQILEISTKERLLKRSVRGGKSRYCYNRDIVMSRH